MFGYFRGSFADEGMERESALSSYDYDEEFEMLVKAYMRDINYTTTNQAAMNIVCSMVNAGLIALPFAAQEAGIPLFVCMMLALSIVSGYTSVLVVGMANERRVRTLEDLAECAFGVKGFFFVSFVQLIFSFSLMCITLNVWADIMSDIFQRSSVKVDYFGNRHEEIYLGAGIILPLCILKKSMSNLRWTSFVTVFAVAGALISVVATYLSDQDMSGDFSDTTAKELCEPKGYWWAFIFIAVYSFSCNQKVLTIYSSLRRRSADRWQVAMQRALAVIFVLYTVFGVCGYVAKDRRDLRIDTFNFFLSDQSEIRNVFDPARGVVAFSLLLTMPVDCLVAATTWRRLWSKTIKHGHLADHLLISAAETGTTPSLTCCAVFCSGSQQQKNVVTNGSIEVAEQGESPFLAQQEQPHQSFGEEEGGGAATSSTPVSTHSRQTTQSKRIYRNSARFSARHQQSSQQSSSSLYRGLMSLFTTGTNTAGNSTMQPRTVHNAAYHAVRSDDNDDVDSSENSKRTTMNTDEEEAVREAIATVEEEEERRRERSVVIEDDERSRRSLVYDDDEDEGQDEDREGSDDAQDREDVYSFRSYDHSRSRSNSGYRQNNSRSSQNNSKNSSLGRGPPPTLFSPGHVNSHSNNNTNRHNNGTDTNSSLHSSALLQLLGQSGNAGTEGFDHQYQQFVDATSWLPDREQVVPTLCLWFITILTALFIDKWLYLAASLGTISTVLLLFVIPAWLYQKLRLVSDFQAIPLFGSVVPNHLYTTLLLAVGGLLLAFDIVIDGYFIITGRHMIEAHS